MSGQLRTRSRFPEWLRLKMPQGDGILETARRMEQSSLATVCEEAKCPNRLECWSAKTATFLAMGKACTRNCGFCDIDFTKVPQELEADEPDRIVEATSALGLKHVVITMVARDDLTDGGAAHLAAILKQLRQKLPEVTQEVLTSDFSGNWEAVQTVLDAGPEIYNHNLETVRGLTPRVRHKATYDRTLALLEYVHGQGKTRYIKSGLMVGLGERQEEVFDALADLKSVGCQIVTIGQYLQPSRRKLLVKEFVTPQQFEAYAEYGRSIGIAHVYSGPFVRSSYNAGAVFEKMQQKEAYG